MYLAQINIAKLLAPIDSPLLADFVADLDRINTLGEQSSGFVWRLKDDSNTAVHLDPFNDKSIIVNMSVWETIDDLKNYVYRTEHVEVFKKRVKWFEKMNEPHLALWWVKKGAFPTAIEGRDRLLHLRKHGETEFAFSFKKIFMTAGL